MNNYSYQEMVDKHQIYGFAECNSVEARHLYANRFSNRCLLNKKTFQRLHEHLRDTGSSKKRVLNNRKLISVNCES